jgi:tellurite resistance protein TerC
LEPPLWYWFAFGAFVAVLLFLDLGIFHRKSKEPSLRGAGLATAVWCALALAFNVLIWRLFDRQVATEFLTGYLIEWSLSMDNVFVFAVIFSYFQVPKKYQYRVLFWGILGAVVMRLTFVLVGVELMQRIQWVIVVFGAFLIYTGFKLAFQGESDPDPEKNPILRLARRMFPVAHGDHGSHFFVRQAGKLCMTPLFLVLLVVESTDVAFAVDSVPAILGVFKDKQAAHVSFIAFTSNVFAILGLRALYFLLAGVMDMFRYLKYGLSAILVFVGFKMLAEYAVHSSDKIADLLGVEHGSHLIPPWASLVVVIGLLAVSIVASLVAKAIDDRRAPHDSAALGSPPSSKPSDSEIAKAAHKRTGEP